jgi:phosphate starvation-inducible protein PhoH and related proteins
MTETPKNELPKRQNYILNFSENNIAPRLFGQFDDNLHFMEKRLGVSMTSRGHELVMLGEEGKIALAKRVLVLLAERIKMNDDIDKGDIDGVIRHVLGKTDVKSMQNGEHITTRRLTIHARTPTQSQYIKSLKSKEMVFGVGPAGTGKTWLAVAFAVSLLDKGAVSKIILTRPAVEAGERLGFLPGDMKEKVDPYLRPIYDALYDVMEASRVERIITSGVIEIAPLAFMRGRTLKDACIILDEAQNTTTMQMKMALTRLGEGSRMIITGDPSQIDLPSSIPSGLVDAINRLKGVEGIDIVHFNQEDVVRHALVGRIVSAYEAKQS